MFLANEDKVYILDKAEGNSQQINGHPAWGAIWWVHITTLISPHVFKSRRYRDIATSQATVMDIYSNTFCASGMHLPNGSFTTFGGNGAISPGGNLGSQLNPGGSSAHYDATYQDYDGTRAIRILNPCNGSNSDIVNNPNCGWWENANVLQMQKSRWYSTAEPLGDGTIALIGGFVNGGYINRNYPNIDPATEGGAAEPTVEFFPSKGDAKNMQFMIDTSGLNSYAHAYMMPSGKMFLQANTSAMLWDPASFQETRLPEMPGGVIRVYPASGGVTMLPLTPANNYNPTILFCGGSDMPEYSWGNYSWPFVDTWLVPASKDCQRITPEPADGSSPTWEQDDDMFDGRTMGQLVSLPDGTILVVNGGAFGTAGYAERTLTTPTYAQMPYGMSLATGPVGRPSIYNPDAPKGSRWNSTGLDTSDIPRLYHSSALLLPDGSVMIAGSNPNVDVNLTTIYPTTYTAEILYPPYYKSTRPAPTGIPSTLTYGGQYFDVTVPSSSYSGSANTAASNTKIMLIRPGWTTHGMSMGQRSLQLNSTYAVNKDGSIVYHVSQVPPNANIFQPGPAFLFVTINGVPSNGSYVIVGSGNIETQTMNPVDTLPASVRDESANGSGSSNNSGNNNSGSNGASSSLSGAAVGGIVAAAIAAIAIFGTALFLLRRRRAAAQRLHSGTLLPHETGVVGAEVANHYRQRDSDSTSFAPLQRSDMTQWGQSRDNLVSPSPYLSGAPSGEFDPYDPRSTHNASAVGLTRY